MPGTGIDVDVAAATGCGEQRPAPTLAATVAANIDSRKKIGHPGHPRFAYAPLHYARAFVCGSMFGVRCEQGTAIPVTECAEARYG